MLRRILIGLAADIARMLDVEVRDGAEARRAQAAWGEACRDACPHCGGSGYAALAGASKKGRGLRR